MNVAVGDVLGHHRQHRRDPGGALFQSRQDFLAGNGAPLRGVQGIVQVLLLACPRDWAARLGGLDPTRQEVIARRHVVGHDRDGALLDRHQRCPVSVRTGADEVGQLGVRGDEVGGFRLPRGDPVIHPRIVLFAAVTRDHESILGTHWLTRSAPGLRRCGSQLPARSWPPS